MVNFYLESRTDKRGDAPIRVSISSSGNRLVTSTGYSINPQLWNKDKQRVKDSYKGKDVANGKGIKSGTINKRLSLIQSHFADLHCSSKEEIQTALDAVIGRSSTDDQPKAADLYTYFDQFIADQSEKKHWTDNTIKAVTSCKNHLQKYGKIRSFEDLTDTVITDYLHYLRKDRALRDNTVKQQYHYFKWFVSWCNRKDLTDLDCKKFDPDFQLVEKTVVFLDWSELMLLYNFTVPAAGADQITTDAASGKEIKRTISADTLEKVRDLFCFCCFTSLRYSDMANLKRTDIVNDKIYLTTVKTKDNITIELNNYSRAILDKYADQIFNKGLALPVISNQKMNEYLKILCQIAGIDAPVKQSYYLNGQLIEETTPKYAVMGTHCGRRTFICNALSMGIAPEIVMKWTGHSSYAAMKPYIDIVAAEKEKAMLLFNKH